MRVSIFYNDAFQQGGAPIGIRHLAQHLARSHAVTLWGETTPHAFPELALVSRRTYRNLPALSRALGAHMKTEHPDVVLVIGFFIHDNMLVVRQARRHSIPVILHPLAQVWDSALEGKVFTHGCDVRELEAQMINRDRLRQRVANRLNPYLKKGFMQTLGRYMAHHCDYVAVLSSEERRQFQLYYHRPDQDFLTLPWGVDEINPSQTDTRHFFREVLGYQDAVPNFIVWSRLDWHYKGLDRLLEGVRSVRDTWQGDALPFRLFLCGPDYREGSLLAQQFIDTHSLQDWARVLYAGDYVPGSKTPLRDADASALLSRWDGSPRALRESLLLGTPIMVSRETNFAEIVRAHDCGMVIDNPDDPQEVAAGLLRLAKPEHMSAWQAGTAVVRTRLNWGAIAVDFIEEVQARLPGTTQAEPSPSTYPVSSIGQLTLVN